MVRYPFEVSSNTALEADLESTIAALQARTTDGTVSALDFADLADAHVRHAQVTGDATDYDQAEAFARRSLELQPAPNGVTLVLAKIANAKHGFRRAIALANQTMLQKPGVGALSVLATAHLALGELDLAIDAAERAVGLRPESATYLMRALVLQGAGRDAEAGFDFARACALELQGDVQESARVRVLWGRFLLRRGELVGAGDLFVEALRIAPDFPLALANQAELALRTGKLAEARAGFERAFAMSRQVRYLIDLARVHELAGDTASADNVRAQVEKIVRAELTATTALPADTGGGAGSGSGSGSGSGTAMITQANAASLGHRLELVETLTDRGRPEDLVESIMLARAEVADRPSADTRIQLARALYRSLARDEAAEQVRLALASGVRDARLYELAARLQQGARKDFYLREADKLDPGKAGWRTLGLEPRVSP